MATPRILIGLVSTLKPAPASGGIRGWTVTLTSGEAALLDGDHPNAAVWLGLLRARQASHWYVGLEVDGAGDRLRGVLLPRAGLVREIVGDDPNGSVSLHFAVARIPFDADHRAALEQAKTQREAVLLTVSRDGSRLLDVRGVPDETAALVARLGAAHSTDTLLPDTTLASQPVISPAQLSAAWSLVTARSCSPCAGEAHCIPFVYPDYGCEGRAHEVCRLLKEQGHQPFKVWLFGAFDVPTANSPKGRVWWYAHVAPALWVEVGRERVAQVLDPSLFCAPVAVADWARRMGKAETDVRLRSAEIYLIDEAGSSVERDPDSSKTERVLEDHRQNVRNRQTDPDGGPPYPQFMPPRPSVLWTGVVPPRSSRTWFSWGWPPAWTVVWSVMPLSICPAGPELHLSVALSRSEGAQCTYWLTVANDSSCGVKFDGRYVVVGPTSPGDTAGVPLPAANVDAMATASGALPAGPAPSPLATSLPADGTA